MQIINQDFIFVDGKIIIRSVFHLDDLVLRPNDVLHLAEPDEKGLVLLISACETQLKIGRVFDNTIISAVDSKPVSPLRWRILNSIIAIERKFGAGVLGSTAWNIAVKGAPIEFQEHLSKDAEYTKISTTYLSELCLLLKEYTPGASIVVAENYDLASTMLNKCSQGCIWFIPKSTEKVSIQMLTTRSWQAPARRIRRMNWANRKAKAVEQKYFSPLPKVHLTPKEDKIASK